VFIIDIDRDKIRMARHNARIYGIKQIEFVTGDFTETVPKLTADILFLSPPWSGPEYKKYKQFDMNRILKPIGGHYIIRLYKCFPQDFLFSPLSVKSSVNI
jgi:trimethylguanosine synthase